MVCPFIFFFEGRIKHLPFENTRKAKDMLTAIEQPLFNYLFQTDSAFKFRDITTQLRCSCGNIFFIVLLLFG